MVKKLVETKSDAVDEFHSAPLNIISEAEMKDIHSNLHYFSKPLLDYMDKILKEKNALPQFQIQAGANGHMFAFHGLLIQPRKW